MERKETNRAKQLSIDKQFQKGVNIIDDRLKKDREIIQARMNELESTYFDLPDKKMEFDRLKYMQ